MIDSDDLQAFHKITTIAAVEKIEKMMVELLMAIDSAQRYHQITRQQNVASAGTATTTGAGAGTGGEGEAGEEVFARQRVRVQQTPAEHELRVAHCLHNRQVVNQLNNKAQTILNQYQQDLKEHHTIDEGARLLELVQAIEDAEKQGHWQQGLFFRTIGDKLNKTRVVFHESALLWHARVQTEQEVKSGLQPQGAVLKTIYVSLYQAGGQNLKNWQYMLSHLAEHTMGRPAYIEREHIEKFVRSRPVPSNEAYLIANVLEKDIIAGLGKGGERTDSEGRPMVSLNKGAVKLENILEFVHSSGRYHIKEGTLVPAQ